ncbi:RNA polymerase sigma-70 factor [Paenibacillus brevis]|uniref:RNA polymerase sigma-70 factor n=1 Tax=Paenibacillus brevis TaxID=2841508 RepID=A0ABS6FUY6_9BACL|nr:RNA polymerase sigma-70 factor [Paenibacillus brevis]MBU5674020.1 RNA polymerase sigma-70 factor [Paenibacillus brevis]
MQISNEEYQRFKPLLFSIAYRMLGSVTDAEDIVQDTFLKAYQMDAQKIENKKAYLCKVVTNRCLDELKSARHRREQYAGPWNPEPLLLEEADGTDPSEILLQKEGLSIAFLRMMEHLAPDERAILLLREALGFSYPEIAAIMDKKEDNCRKILSRAKRRTSRIEDESLSYERNKSLVERFIHAFQKQQTDILLELLSENVTLYSDGGGIVRAALRPVISSSNVLSLLYGVINKAPQDFRFEIKNVNHQPAIVVEQKGALAGILSFYICDDKIIELYLTMNPEKLP